MLDTTEKQCLESLISSKTKSESKTKTEEERWGPGLTGREHVCGLHKDFLTYWVLNSASGSCPGVSLHFILRQGLGRLL